jgi:myo-inositol-1(or 4)-monophosphatase
MKKNSFGKVYLNFAINLALEAGEILLKYEKKINTFDIKYKKGEGVACAADLASENFITKNILKKYPDHCILAEESYADATCVKEAPTWIIDPLDGTSNYLNKLPYYAVCISLMNEDEIVLGVVFRPTTGELFYAQKGKGSFYKAHFNDARAKKIHSSSNTKKLSDCVFATNIYLDLGNKLKYDSKFLKNNSRAIRRMGSAVLDQCYTALGNLDGFWDPNLHPWDLAASSIIAKEAGCKVVNFDSKKFDSFSRSILIAREPLFKKIKSTFKI